MSQLCKLISWSMAFHSSGLRQLNSSPTAENKLLFTALATCGKPDTYTKFFLCDMKTFSPGQTGNLTLTQLRLDSRLNSWARAALKS